MLPGGPAPFEGEREERALNADLKAAEPPGVVKIAAAVQALAGLFVGLCGLQVVTGVVWAHAWMGAIPYVLLLIGGGAIFMAANQYRARAWAGVGSAVYDAVLALVATGWGMFSFTGMFSCMTVVAVPLALLSGLLSLLAMKGVKDTADARRRLADQGMGLGL